MIENLTIMVVEDEELLLQAITKKMATQGIKAIACVSGKEAIEHLNDPAQKPDVIWLDYYLKDMNGLEFMDYLKKTPQLANIPVLVVSNSASEDKVNHMLALGANKYILKAEHRLDEIVAMVESIAADAKKETA